MALTIEGVASERLPCPRDGLSVCRGILEESKAGLLAKLMNRHVWIVWLGGGLLGYVAGEMMMEDRAVRAWLGDGASRFEKPAAIVIAVTVAAIGWWEARQKPPHVPEDI